MDQEIRAFALSYDRFMRLVGRMSATAPAATQAFLARWMGRLLSPYRQRAAAMSSAMGQALMLDAEETRRFWYDWLENHGLFALSTYHFRSLNTGWLSSRITVENSELLSLLKIQGGLVMTYHCHHQNLIAARIGIACGNMTALAASANSSPLYPYLGPHIERINCDSARWFGDGYYLFTDKRIELVRKTQARLSSGKVVLTLSDTPWPVRTNMPAGHIFGRQISPPTGAVAIAVRLGKPIVAAIMIPGSEGLTLRLRRLVSSADVAAVLSDYFFFLETTARNFPACCQGWEWWHSLPARH